MFIDIPIKESVLASITSKKGHHTFVKYGGLNSFLRFYEGKQLVVLHPHYQLPSVNSQLLLPRILLVFIDPLGMHYIAFAPTGTVLNKEVNPNSTGDAHQWRLQQH